MIGDGNSGIAVFSGSRKGRKYHTAAESLHIAQPSLSKQLMELEREFGKPLLVRGKRKITLTKEGILLRKRAEEILELVEKTEWEIGSDDEEILGDIYIGGSAAESILRGAARLRPQYPGIRFHFTVAMQWMCRND